jgi:hypothetical protein
MDFGSKFRRLSSEDIQHIVDSVVAQLTPLIHEIPLSNAAAAAIAAREALDTVFIGLTQEIQKMSAELDALTAQVAQNCQVTQSAITLIQGLAQQIMNNVNDPTALAALASDLQAQDSALADAVAQNTLAPPPVPPTP